jgi:hypothetical protein
MIVYSNQSSQLNYWPLKNTLADIVLGVKLHAADTNTSDPDPEATYLLDRFKRKNLALHIDPTLSYFVHTTDPFTLPTGDFTITMWIKLNQCSHLLSAMCGAQSEAHIMSLPLANTTSACQSVFRTDNKTYTVSANIPLNAWTHVAAARVSTKLHLYVNGVELVHKSLPVIKFESEVVGALKTNSTDGILVLGADLSGENLASGVFDEVKVFGSGLSQEAVSMDMGFEAYLIKL